MYAGGDQNVDDVDQASKYTLELNTRFWFFSLMKIADALALMPCHLTKVKVTLDFKGNRILERLLMTK